VVFVKVIEIQHQIVPVRRGIFIKIGSDNALNRAHLHAKITEKASFDIHPEKGRLSVFSLSLSLYGNNIVGADSGALPAGNADILSLFILQKLKMPAEQGSDYHALLRILNSDRLFKHMLYGSLEPDEQVYQKYCLQPFLEHGYQPLLRIDKKFRRFNLSESKSVLC
jgi:hypothetical protein